MHELMEIESKEKGRVTKKEDAVDVQEQSRPSAFHMRFSPPPRESKFCGIKAIPSPVPTFVICHTRNAMQ